MLGRYGVSEGEPLHLSILAKFKYDHGCVRCVGSQLYCYDHGSP